MNTLAYDCLFERDGLFEALLAASSSSSVIRRRVHNRVALIASTISIALDRDRTVVAAGQKSKLQSTGSDDLEEASKENALMLRYYRESKLLIDPEGRGIKLWHELNKKQGKRALIVTSFLSPKFAQSLSNALRFGAEVLICDAESFDPSVATAFEVS